MSCEKKVYERKNQEMSAFNMLNETGIFHSIPTCIDTILKLTCNFCSFSHINLVIHFLMKQYFSSCWICL